MDQNNNKKGNQSPTKRGSLSPEKEKVKKTKITKKNEDWKKTCQFCGTKDIKSLDEHFITECLSLFSCKYCEQLVEIQDMKNHYRGECVASKNF